MHARARARARARTHAHARTRMHAAHTSSFWEPLDTFYGL